MKSTEGYVTVHVRIPPEDYAALARAAKVGELKISGALRLAIRQWVERFLASEGSAE